MVPTCHYNMGGIPTNHLTEVVTRANGSRYAHQRPDGGGRGQLHVGARGQPARRQLADRPRRVRPGGLRTGERDRVPRRRAAPVAKDAGEAAIERLDRTRHAAGAQSTGEIRLNMQRTMQRYAAVFRTGEV